jgi:hypothetical protein
MNPRWPERRSSTDTVKTTARIREALEWIAHDLNRPENKNTWAALAEMEPERTRIQLFDCVWWIYFRQIEPVPPPAKSELPQSE